MNEETCAVGAKNSTMIGDLQRRMENVEHAILDMRDRLLGRPSWAVCTIIAFLSSVSIGCISFAFTIIRTLGHG